MTKTLFASFAAALLFLNCVGGGACAHDTFLLPTSFEPASQPVDIPLTSAEAFPKLEYGPKADRVADTQAFGPGEAKLVVSSHADNALHFSLTTAGSGEFVIGVSLAPHDIDLNAAKVAEYFEEIGATPDVREAYQRLPMPRQWHETYRKFAKSLVCIASCAGLAGRRPLGHALEFVLVSRDGRRQSFRLLRRGNALAHFPIAISDGQTRKLVATDDNGEVEVISDRPYRPILLSSVFIAPSRLNERFQSEFATLTFGSPSR